MKFVKQQTKILAQKILHKFGYHAIPRKNNSAPLGHSSDPVPVIEEIIKRKQQIFKIKKKEIDGIDLNEKAQLNLLEEIRKYYNEIPFEDDKKEELRYYFRNKLYSYSDAIFLYSVIRYFQPSRIIEIGSGFSSAVMLDTNEYFLENKCSCTFIEPYPEQFSSTMSEKDAKTHKIIKSFVQDVDLNVFKQLKENDILFVDSFHVAKTGSDVNHIFFEILPQLNRGVLIHFHDIFYPFEYPENWILEKNIAWNENYILRAFLQYNKNFKIILFNTFLEYYHEDWFCKNMPLCLKNKGGSIWLQKL
jgi:predicted O-methyltransferase YrrM